MKRKINIDRPGLDPREISQRRDADFEKVLKANPSRSSGGGRGWYITGGLAALVVVGLVIFFMTRSSTSPQVPQGGSLAVDRPAVKTTSDSAVATPFIHPPVRGLNMPYQVFTVNAGRGGAFTYKRHGSTFTIPANAFMYGDGTSVNGDVAIKYREMHDVAEVFVSGIPMTYDSAGQRYHFETAGMVEITAWKDGQQVHLKQGKKMEIKMRSYVDGNRFNLYNLDTIARNWKYLGKDKIEKQGGANQVPNEIFVFYPEGIPTLPGNNIQDKSESLNQELTTLKQSEPLPPRKANPKRYRFDIQVNPTEFPELATFKGVQFEVDSSERSFTSEAYKKQWQDISLEEVKRGVTYRMRLENTNEEQFYLVHPVYEGKAYETALEQFNENYASYTKKVKQKEDEIKRIKEEREAAMKEYYAEQKKQLGKQFNKLDAVTKIYRTFSVSGFGTYNCDCPQMFPKGAPITAKFQDEQGRPVKMTSPYLVEKGRNAMFYLYGEPGWTSTTFRYNRHSGNMIFGATKEGRVAVYSSEDFDKIPADAKSYTFKMHMLEQEFTDVDELKRYLGI